MIIVRLAGGLGNQMFQYAFGRALSLRNGYEFKVDASDYTETYHRPYELLHFKAEDRRVSHEEASKARLPYGFFSRLLRAFKARILRIQHIGYVPRILNAPDGAYLEGYWQSEKYFKDIADTVREDFTLKEPFSPAAEKWAKIIETTPLAISLHVRRGDYVSQAKVNARHGTCDARYYEDAAEDLARRGFRDATLFVFSDEIAWAKANLHLPFKMEFVSDSVILPHEEMILMSLCKHHVIANSSFSWWGAWLNPRKDKIVIAPKTWFKGTNPRVYKDIVPESWIKI